MQSTFIAFMNDVGLFAVAVGLLAIADAIRKLRP